MSLRRDFEERAEEFREAARTPAHREIVACLAARIAPAPEGRVLEVGCGAGALLAALRAAGRPAVGCDFATAMCRAARDASGASVVAAEAARLPFAGGAFAAVAGMLVLQIVADEAAALAEARRVLAPGGLIALVVQAEGFDEPAGERLAAARGASPAEARWLVHCAHRRPGSRRYVADGLARLLRRTSFEAPSVGTLLDGGLLCATARKAV